MSAMKAETLRAGAGSLRNNLTVAGADTGPVARLAAAALLREVLLTPKPGLVDQVNTGAHLDMDLPLFMRSITAIVPWFSRFSALGHDYAGLPAGDMLARIRPVGLACEQAMFAATHGINTHKGGIFSLGLLCTAAGRINGRRQPLTRNGLCGEVAAICAHMVERELAGCRRPASVGEHLFLRYGLTGARGEAGSGFATVRRYALPAWERLKAGGAAEQTVMLHCLLLLMAHNRDTNLVARGGLPGLYFVQRYARRLLRSDWDAGQVQRMDAALIERRLSPGGSADLLAVAYVLAHLPV